MSTDHNSSARIVCPQCHGSGECNDADFGDIFYNIWQCPECKGSGTVSIPNTAQDALKLRRARCLINYQGQRIKLLEARIDRQNERPAEPDCSIGVGAGFVHGSYEACKAVQQFIFRAEREARLEQMLAKIYPHFAGYVAKELNDGGCGPEMTTLLELRDAIEAEFSRGPDGKPR